MFHPDCHRIWQEEWRLQFATAFHGPGKKSKVPEKKGTTEETSSKKNTEGGWHFTNAIPSLED
jgi:hypothetical protein